MTRSAEIAFFEGLTHSIANDLIPGAEVVACGSYRRGKAASGDCDLVVTFPDGGLHSLADILRLMHTDAHACTRSTPARLKHAWPPWLSCHVLCAITQRPARSP